MDAEQAIAEFLVTDTTTYHTPPLILAAVPVVHQHDIALYDAVYLALAHQLNVPLLMAERRLYQRIQSIADVVWLGDYAPPARKRSRG